MELTMKEQWVVDALRRRVIAQSEQLQAELSVSGMTVFRGLKKYGYFSSLNQNASYLTLKETPKFDSEGLWIYGEVVFGHHGSLLETIEALVGASDCGLTAGELEDRLGTRVHNQLSQLLRKQMIRRFKEGRQAIYVSLDVDIAQRQRERRLAEIGLREEQGELLGDWVQAMVPPGLQWEAVIRTLMQMIETPEASVASLSRRLQASGLVISARQIRKIVAFYGLEKKTDRWRCQKLSGD
jgi:hypothetical protein